MYCISFPRNFSCIKQQLSPTFDTNSILGNITSGKRGTTLRAARKQNQRPMISIFFCHFYSGDLRRKLNEKVHVLMDRWSTPPCTPPVLWEPRVGTLWLVWCLAKSTLLLVHLLTQKACHRRDSDTYWDPKINNTDSHSRPFLSSFSISYPIF